MYRRSFLDQISPPSSPDLNAQDGYTLEVSPIDDDDEFYWPKHQVQQNTQPTPPSPRNTASPTSLTKTSIPSMRRDRRKVQEAAAAATREAKTKDRQRDKQRLATHPPPSRTGGVKLDAPVGVVPFDPSHASEFGVTTTVTSNGPIPEVHTSFGQRVRQQLARSKPDPLETRPPWQGASGRSSLLQPLRDNLTAQPLSVSPRLNKLASRTGEPYSASASPVSPYDSETAGGPVAALRRLLPTSGVKGPHPNGDIVAHAKSPVMSYPSPPYVVDSPVSLSPTSGHPNTSPTSAPPAGANDPNKLIKRKPPPTAPAVLTAPPHHVAHQSISSSVYSAQPEHIEPVAHATEGAAPPEQWLQPPSRFSVTTYATSSVDSTHLSRDGDEEQPPLPDSQLTSVMDRTRPIPADSKTPTNAPILISMQNTYSESPIALTEDEKAINLGLYHDDLNTDEQAISIMSTSKALPPAPPELSAADRVGQLNARLESLAYRRVNITRSIKQMTELMPATNILASAEVLRRRDSEKQKVEQLKAELAEVQREEYDLGLKLHLAYKRLERDSEYESSSLWVRRVTG